MTEDIKKELLLIIDDVKNLIYAVDHEKIITISDMRNILVKLENVILLSECNNESKQ